MEFQSYPKIPRLNRDIVVTEKIDGTNAAVLIEPWDGQDGNANGTAILVYDEAADQWVTLQAQSRNRFVTPQQDNAGFARWVFSRADELVSLLGPGRHFGEWWGQGIQRNYGLTYKKFSLFNPDFDFGPDPAQLLWSEEVSTVPVLYRGPFSQQEINLTVDMLATGGSIAAPDFPNPEGVIVYHTAARSLFKVTCKDDEKPKGQ